MPKLYIVLVSGLLGFAVTVAVIEWRDRPQPFPGGLYFNDAGQQVMYFDGGGSLTVLNTVECEDGTAPTVGADGVGRCPYTYAQQMRARNRRSNGAYFEGIDDALETWMLLDLELRMTGERKTNGERANIVRQRHGMEEEQ